MDIFALLKKDPDQAVQIADEKQAREFLRDLRLDSLFSDEPRVWEQPTVQICGFEGSKTHLIIAFKFSGLPDKNENGFLIACPPRSGFAPGLTSADFVTGAAREHSEQGLRVVVHTPRSNN